MESFSTQEITNVPQAIDLFSPEKLLGYLEKEIQISFTEFGNPILFPSLSNKELQKVEQFYYSKDFKTNSGSIIFVCFKAKSGPDTRSRILEVFIYKDSCPLKFTVVTPTPFLFSQNLKKCLLSLFNSDTENSFLLRIVVSAGKDFNYSRAVNFGMANSVGDIILLNDDCYVSKGTIRSMLEKGSATGNIIGCQLKFPNGNLQHNGGRVISNPIKVFYGLAVRSKAPFFAIKYFMKNRAKGLNSLTIFNLKKIHPVELDFVTAALCLIPKKVVKTIGGFDERYCNQFDDVDFCFRARKSGFGLTIDRDYPAVHEEHKSLSSLYIDGEINYKIFAETWFPKKTNITPRYVIGFLSKIEEVIRNVLSI